MSKEYIDRWEFMEELTKLEKTADEHHKFGIELAMLKLGEHREADVVELPCKIGDTVYFETFDTVNNRCVGIQPHKITDFRLDMMVERKFCCPITWLPHEDFGQFVFLTKEEAEAALSGGKDNG